MVALDLTTGSQLHLQHSIDQPSVADLELSKEFKSLSQNNTTNVIQHSSRRALLKVVKPDDFSPCPYGHFRRYGKDACNGCRLEGHFIALS
jgi:hypothetical protein